MSAPEETVRAALDRLVERADLDLAPPPLGEPLATASAGGRPRRNRRRALLAAAVLAIGALAGVVVWAGRHGDPVRVTTDPSPDRDPAPGPSGWRQVDDLPVDEVTSVATAWSGSELFVVGGYLPPCRPDLDCVGAGVASAQGAALDPESGRWRRIAELPEPLAAPSLAVVEGSVYAWPSGIRDDQPNGRLFSYDIAEDEWTVIDAPFSATHGYQLVEAEDRVLVAKGSDEGGEEPIRAYQPATGRWLALPDDPLPLLFDQTVVREGDAIFLFGKEIAKLGGSEPPLVIGARFDLDAQAWTELPASEARPTGLARVGDGRMVNPSLLAADGGEVNNWGRSYPEGVVFDARTETWEPLPELPEDMEGGGAGFLGIGAVRYPPFGGPMLDLRTDRWIEVPRPPGVERSRFRTVAAAGDEAVVLAGGDWDAPDGPVPLADVWVWRPQPPSAASEPVRAPDEPTAEQLDAPPGMVAVVDGEGRFAGYVEVHDDLGPEANGTVALGSRHALLGAPVTDRDGALTGYLVAPMGFVPKDQAEDPEVIDRLYEDHLTWEAEARATFEEEFGHPPDGGG